MENPDLNTAWWNNDKHVIWFSDLFKHHEAIACLKKHGVDTSRFVYVKEQQSSRRGMGIPTAELMVLCKLYL